MEKQKRQVARVPVVSCLLNSYHILMQVNSLRIFAQSILDHGTRNLLWPNALPACHRPDKLSVFEAASVRMGELFPSILPWPE